MNFFKVTIESEFVVEVSGDRTEELLVYCIFSFILSLSHNDFNHLIANFTVHYVSWWPNPLEIMCFVIKLSGDLLQKSMDFCHIDDILSAILAVKLRMTLLLSLINRLGTP